MIDNKYDTKNPNIFCSKKLGRSTSQFFKGVIGNGEQIRFWEDTWFGSSPLAVQYFKIYYVCNEQNKTIAHVWDGSTLMLTFRRNFTENMRPQWLELLGILPPVSVFLVTKML